MQTPDALGIIAGNGVYPRLLADAARRAGVKKIVAAAFTGETDERLTNKVDEVHWMRVGQLGKLISCFRTAGVAHAIMAGQIAPKNLFDLRPDWKTLLLLARLKRRNAESIFAAIGDEPAGDPLRRIHWRSTARRGELIVREFEPPGVQNVGIFLDPDPTSEAGADQVARIAASEALECLRAGGRVTMWAPGCEATRPDEARNFLACAAFLIPSSETLSP